MILHDSPRPSIEAVQQSINNAIDRLRLSEEDSALVAACIQKYSKPASFCAALTWLVNRIANGVKSLWSRSDWNLAQKAIVRTYTTLTKKMSGEFTIHNERLAWIDLEIQRSKIQSNQTKSLPQKDRIGNLENRISQEAEMREKLSEDYKELSPVQINAKLRLDYFSLADAAASLEETVQKFQAINFDPLAGEYLTELVEARSTMRGVEKTELGYQILQIESFNESDLKEKLSTWDKNGQLFQEFLDGLDRNGSIFAALRASVNYTAPA